MGTHRSILCGIADAAMGLAYASTLEAREKSAVLELKMNFLKPVRRGRLIAVAYVVSRGGAVGLVECDVTDDGEELVARASALVWYLAALVRDLPELPRSRGKGTVNDAKRARPAAQTATPGTAGATYHLLGRADARAPHGHGCRRCRHGHTRGRPAPERSRCDGP